MKVKSLLVAGTVATTLGVSAFSITPLTHAASTEITAAMFDNAEACGVDANFVVTVPNNVICVNGDAYYFGNGEYVINEDVNITKTLHLDNSTLTINKGTFSPTGADAIYLHRNSNLTVNDGTFSGVFAGIMAETDLSGAPFVGTIKINGGTISGGRVALAMEYGEGLGNRVVLKGGTFNGSNPGDYYKNAIVVLNSADTTLFDSFLASGYHYTNNTKYSTTTNMIASLGGTSTKVEADTTTSTDTNTSTNNNNNNNNNNTNTNTPTTDNKKKAMEEMSKGMEKVIASSTSSKSTKKAAAKKTIKAPNTGAVK